jgi:hypothetical protein
MATAHLIHGYLGAGKTTLARRLERERSAIRLTPDEWMSRLFGPDPHAETFRAKETAILELMEPLWSKCLSQGVDVVLDFGFWRRIQRDRVRRLAGEVGANAVLYHVTCDDSEARRRIAGRNTRDSEGLYIAPETFDVLRPEFEALEPDEPAVRVSTQDPASRTP